MGERKGVNKYYPPDYDPAKGGLNAYHGTHALRERARKLHEGILIIRFEMPYNIWCNGCGKHIGMGVRYNAQKRKMGNYYTTPIYKFRMKCHLCDQHFEIQTDPKNCDYQILSGCRRKEERWDTEKAGNVQTTHREVKEKMMTNAMYKLEHEVDDKLKVKKIAPTLTRLEEIRDDWKDDFAVNQLMRKKFRAERKDIQQQKASDDDFKERKNLPDSFDLVKESEDDVKKAHRIRFGQDSSTPDILLSLRRRKIKQSSIFGTSGTKAELAKSLLPTKRTKTVAMPTPNKTLHSDIIGVKVKVNPRKNVALNDEYKKGLGDNDTENIMTGSSENERGSEECIANNTNNESNKEERNSKLLNLVDYNSSSSDCSNDT